jgi:hypothetical protein
MSRHPQPTNLSAVVKQRLGVHRTALRTALRAALRDDVQAAVGVHDVQPYVRHPQGARDRADDHGCDVRRQQHRLQALAELGQHARRLVPLAVHEVVHGALGTRAHRQEGECCGRGGEPGGQGPGQPQARHQRRHDQGVAGGQQCQHRRVDQ